jgi:hypothetical protein
MRIAGRPGQVAGRTELLLTPTMTRRALDLLVVNSTRSLGQIRGLSGQAAGADCAAW